MHCMCTRTDYSLFSWAWNVVPYPAGVEHDFLEVPSQALENWVWEESVLRMLSHHVHTGAPMPKELAAKLAASRRLGESIRCGPACHAGGSGVGAAGTANVWDDVFSGRLSGPGTAGRSFCPCWTWNCTALPSRRFAPSRTCRPSTTSATARSLAWTPCPVGVQAREGPSRRRCADHKHIRHAFPSGCRHRAAGDVLPHLLGLRRRLLRLPLVRSVRERHLRQVRAAASARARWRELSPHAARPSRPGNCARADAHRFKDSPDGCFDTLLGLNYRRNILEPGATRDGKNMLKSFLGREPSTDAFLRLVIGQDGVGADRQSPAQHEQH